MLRSSRPPLVVVVGAGGVGKTTLAAAMGTVSARAGHDTLVMTFDPSLRLKDTLGVGEEARDEEIPVPFEGKGRLFASLLDAGRTFDRLVADYAPDPEARDRILGNRYYRHLAGTLGGILEYMAVERLYEVVREGRYDRIVLDTPPTRQAIDFLEAPSRIVGFLDSGAIRLALKQWFDEEGHLRGTTRLGFLGRRLEGWLDDVVGLDLLADMAEFFQAFGPLYSGFRERARAVEDLLRAPETVFVLVGGPGEERNPDTLFFARRLVEAGHRLGAVVVNQVHPSGDGARPLDKRPDPSDGRALLEWLAARDRRGIEALKGLLSPDDVLVILPLLPREPTDLQSLSALGEDLAERLEARVPSS